MLIKEFYPIYFLVSQSSATSLSYHRNETSGISNTFKLIADEPSFVNEGKSTLIQRTTVQKNKVPNDLCSTKNHTETHIFDGSNGISFSNSASIKFSNSVCELNIILSPTAATSGEQIPNSIGLAQDINDSINDIKISKSISIEVIKDTNTHNPFKGPLLMVNPLSRSETNILSEKSNSNNEAIRVVSSNDISSLKPFLSELPMNDLSKVQNLMQI